MRCLRGSGRTARHSRSSRCVAVRSLCRLAKLTTHAAQSPLEFTIHLQAYIELCRARDAVSAIAYARKHLSPATAAELETSGPSGDEGADGSGKGSLMSELSRAMALLAYPPDTTCRVYQVRSLLPFPYSFSLTRSSLAAQDLYSPLRWAHLRSLFRTTFLTLHSLPSIPLLHMSLQAGIASLKTPICCPVPSGTKTAPPSAWPLGGVKGLRTSITPDGEIVFSTSGGSGADSPSLTGTNGATQPPVHTLEGSPSPNCPLCSSPLSALGPDVPYSHHVNSTIVCGITGKVVEGDGGEGGQLVALVSRVTGEGRVYSKEVRCAVSLSSFASPLRAAGNGGLMRSLCFGAGTRTTRVAASRGQTDRPRDGRGVRVGRVEEGAFARQHFSSLAGY